MVFSPLNSSSFEFTSEFGILESVCNPSDELSNKFSKAVFSVLNNSSFKFYSEFGISESVCVDISQHDNNDDALLSGFRCVVFIIFPIEKYVIGVNTC